MMAGALRQLVSLGLWGGVCSLFSFFLGSGNLFLGAAILALMLVYGAILIGPQLIAALWLMGAPTVFGYANPFLKVLPFITCERLLFLILVGMMFLRAAFLKTKTPPLSRLEILIVLFLGYALISLLASTTAELWRRDLWFLMQYAIPMAMFIVSRRMDWTARGVKLLLASLTLTGVAMAAIGVMQSLFGVTIFNVKTVTSGHVDRAYGMFSSAHTYSATLVIFLTLTLFQFNLYRDALVRSALVAAMLAMLVGIVLGQTRAPWGGAALTLLIIFARDRDVRPLLLVGGVIAALAGAVFLAMRFDELGSFVERVTNLKTLVSRLALWATALNMIAHNPLFGVGFGAVAFELHRPQYITGIGIGITAHYGVDLGVPHNEYLHVGALLGLVGLLAYLAIVVGIVRLMFTLHNDARGSPMGRRLALYVGAIVIGLLFTSLLADTHVMDYFWMLAYFLAGFAAVVHRGAVWREHVAVRGRRVESPA